MSADTINTNIYPVNYTLTFSLLNKKTSENCALSIVQRMGYIALAAFTAICETFRNVCSMILNAVFSLKTSSAPWFYGPDYFIAMDQLLGTDSPSSLHNLVESLKSTQSPQEIIVIPLQEQIAIREALKQKNITREDIFALMRSQTI